MARRNTEDFVEKKKKNKSTENKSKKRKIIKSVLNYGPYLCKVLKNHHPRLSLSVKSINILNSFGNDIFERIASEASRLANYVDHKTMTSAQIQSAVSLVLPPGLAPLATEYGKAACLKYFTDKKDNNRNSLEMTEESREVWVKCFSKTKNMVYYWNSKTHDSIWEEHCKNLVNKPNVIIEDKTVEMKNGKLPNYKPTTEITARSNNGIITKTRLNVTSGLKSGSEDDDDDDADFNDTLNAFYESSHSSSSIFNGSQGSFTNHGTSSGYNRRHSEPMPKSFRTENTMDKRKSAEIHLPKALMTCTKPSVKPFTNCDKRKLSDPLPKKSSIAKGTSFSPPKIVNKGTQKLPPQIRYKTPIQDRKMKEKQELLLKQKQKNNRSTYNLPDIITGSSGAPLHGISPLSSNGEIEAPNLKNFVIPRRRMCNRNSDQESGRESQLRSPSQLPPTPPQVPGPLVPPKITSSTKRSSENLVHTTPPSLQVEGVDMPSAAALPSPALLPTPPYREKVLETVTSYFKNPSPISPLHSKHTLRGSGNSIEENDKMKVDSVRAQETVLDHCNQPSLVLPQNLKRTVRSSIPAEECDKIEFGVNRVQETVKFQFKNPLPCSAQTLKHTEVGSCNSVEESIKRKQDSDRAVSSKRTKFSYENTHEPTTELTSAKPVPTSALGSAPFDARQVLERRRSRQSETVSKPSCSNQDDHTMEWEGIESSASEDGCKRNIKERLGQPCSAQNTATIMSQLQLQYKPAVIVCDTNALIHYIDKVEELLYGNLLGIPVKLVIPYQVFRELDNMKKHSERAIMDGARAAVRMLNEITESKFSAEYNLEIQSSTMHREKAKESLELEKNDDFILNCALQQRKAHGEDKTVILLTADAHLAVMTRVENITSKTPASLKRWAREYKESVRLQMLGMSEEIPQSSRAFSTIRTSDSHQPSETKMDIDRDPGPLASSSTFSLSTSVNQTETSETFKSCSKFYAESLNYDLLQFLKCVIDKCNERVFGEWKRHASQPKPSWTLLQCISKVVERWNTLTEKTLSCKAHNNIKQIVNIVKKFNKGKEEFTKSDMKMYFSCCQILGKEFLELYNDVSDYFLQRVADLLEEWEQKSMSNPVSSCDEDDPQPADMALQNIYNCMRSDYNSWKARVQREPDDNKNELEVRLQAFYRKVSNMLRILDSALEKFPQSSLTIDDECIYDILKETTVFAAEDGNILTFELTRENILTLFVNKNLRTGVQGLVDKIRRLQKDIMVLLEEVISSDSDDLDFD